jgi:hypothetical protein
MDAKKLKPYTFWIVSGVVVVIELGLLALWPIEDESGATPEVVKQKLDTEFKKLQELHKRADHAPSGVYDAEKPEDIKRLTEEYLLTPQWKGVLQPHVDKYNQQLTAIKKYLAERSAVLHESIAESSDLFAWYTAYSKKTKDVMLALQKANVLVVDPKSKDESDFENGKDVRARVGFYTKGEITTAASEHAKLTAQFHIMRTISDALMASKSTAVANPVVKNQHEADFETKRPVIIKEVVWKGSGDSAKMLSGPIAEIAGAYELALVLEGSTSALILAQAAIEAISEPVMIVTGGELSARGQMPAGVRKNVADEPVKLRLNIAVIDFNRILSVTASTEATAGGAVK